MAMLYAVSPGGTTQSINITTMNIDSFLGLEGGWGWHKDASGLIMQWGSDTISNGEKYITYDIAFPRKCLSLMTAAQHYGYNQATTIAAIGHNGGLTQAHLSAYNGNSSKATITIHFLFLGC